MRLVPNGKRDRETGWNQRASAGQERQFFANRRAEEQLTSSSHLDLKLDPYSGQREELLNELGEAWEEYRNANWDGYGAIQVSEETFQHARRFVKALPPDIPNPTIGGDPDGHLTLEWYRSPRCILSVSVSPEGDLHYAALREVTSKVAGNGSKVSKSYGTEPFSGEIPESILRLVSQVMGA